MLMQQQTADNGCAMKLVESPGTMEILDHLGMRYARPTIALLDLMMPAQGWCTERSTSCSSNRPV